MLVRVFLVFNIREAPNFIQVTIQVTMIPFREVGYLGAMKVKKLTKHRRRNILTNYE